MAIYLSRRVRRDRLQEIGEGFKIGRLGAVSSGAEKRKVRMGRDESLRKRRGWSHSDSHHESRADLTPLQTPLHSWIPGKPVEKGGIKPLTNVSAGRIKK